MNINRDPRYTVIGEKRIEEAPNFKVPPYSVDFVGISIKTDDPILAENFAAVNDTRHNNLGITLYYLTNSTLPFEDDTGQPIIKPMTAYDRGLIYMSYDMSTFSFSGAGLFGVASSLAYGIRSLSMIEEGVLGIHSSAIFDTKTEECYLIAGNGTLGKSTISKMIADSSDGHFIMACDDWVEVDVNHVEVNSISPVYSSDTPLPSRDDGFTSFGKSFYKMPLDIPRRMNLGGIIQISGNDSFDLDDLEKFVQGAMGHIPFINMPPKETLVVSSLTQGTAASHVVERIDHLRSQYMRGYSMVAEKYLLGHIVNTKDSQTPLEKLKEDILALIS